jgi:NAD(P)-dependent dehydrogenase (short-subunit alcohol dehydrogenase family)
VTARGHSPRHRAGLERLDLNRAIEREVYEQPTAEVALLGDGESRLREQLAHGQLAEARVGELDVLFVNAGLGRFAPFEAVNEELYDEMLNLNAKGRISLSRNWCRSCRKEVRWSLPLRLPT